MSTANRLWWISRWCRRHSSTRFDSAVRPPLVQWTTWWGSHHDGGPPAVGERAPAVPHEERLADPRRGDPRRPSHVERSRRRVGDHPRHLGIAGPHQGVLGGDRSDVCKPPAKPRMSGTSGARRVLASVQALDVDGDDDVGTLAGHHRPVLRVEPLTAELPQGVGPATGGRAGVRAVARTELGVLNRPERRGHDLSGLGVEIASEPAPTSKRRR